VQLKKNSSCLGVGSTQDPQPGKGIMVQKHLLIGTIIQGTEGVIETLSLRAGENHAKVGFYCSQPGVKGWWNVSFVRHLLFQKIKPPK